MIVMPAFAEWDNLRELVPIMSSLLSKAEASFRWVVVTEPIGPGHDERVAIFQDLDVSPSFVAREHGRESFADAIRIGLGQLTEHDDFIIFLDADQSHDPRIVSKLLAKFKENPKLDVAIASRYVKGGTTENGVVLRLMSQLLNYVYRIVLKINVKDLSTNFKCFRAELLINADLISTNFEVVEELLVHASIRRELSGRKLQVLEVPDHFAARKHGVSKRKLGQFIGTYLLSLLVMKKKLRRAYQRAASRVDL